MRFSSAHKRMSGPSQPSPADRTPLPMRVYRYARVSLHVFQGIATTAFVFPMIGLPRRQALIRRWSERLLRIMHVEAQVQGLPAGGLPGNMLIVANHISWLDIFVLNTVQPARFIAKAELKRWPLVGLMIAGCGTLFIERERRRDAHRVNDHARAKFWPRGTPSPFFRKAPRPTARHCFRFTARCCSR